MNDLLDQRQKLEARISAYEQWISVIMKLDDKTQWSTKVGKCWEIDSNGADFSDNVLVHYPDGWFTPARESITSPSTLAPGEIDCQSLQPIAMIKTELQKGQVTDALEGLHWLSERSPYASEQRCTMQTASGQCIAHGIECINLVQTLGNAAQHINIHVVLCSIYKLTWNIWPCFMILPKMI